MSRLGAELGAAIRKVVTQVHRLAPSSEGHPVPVIEERLKEAEDEVLQQLHTVDDRLERWRQDA